MKYLLLILLTGCAHSGGSFRLHYNDWVAVKAEYPQQDSFYNVRGKIGTVIDYYQGKTRCYPEVRYDVAFNFDGTTKVLEFCENQLIKLGGNRE